MLANAMPATAGYDADDNNSGFMTTMKFARGAYPDQKIVLTENHRKESPNKRAMSAAARRRRQPFQKHIITSGSTGPANPRRTSSWNASNTS
jgi:hypothetical protein